MNRGQKWALGIGLATVALSAAAWLAAVLWLPSDKDIAARLTAAAEDQLGVKVTIGSAHWALLPTPSVVVNDVRTQQTQPVIIRQLSAHLNLRMLLHRKYVLDRLDIDDAVFPHSAMLAFHAKPGAAEPDAGDGVPLEHLAFRNATWISYSGIAVVYDGEVDFDAHWRPRHAELRRPGSSTLFTLTATREGDTDRWQTRIRVGGGTADGYLTLTSATSGAMHLRGQFAPHDVEVASAMSSFNRRSSVGGKGSGTTMVSADGNSARELARSLHTRTMFSVDTATIFRFHLDKAISTHGKEYDGQTALQLLTGQMDTQNTDEGMRIVFTGGKARAGIYTATGEATIYKRQIDANGLMYLVVGAIGVPFTVRGPVENPVVSVPPGFLAGAAIGTVVLPGIGTVIGARVGGLLGRIFDGGAPRTVH